MRTFQARLSWSVWVGEIFKSFLAESLQGKRFQMFGPVPQHPPPPPGSPSLPVLRRKAPKIRVEGRTLPSWPGMTRWLGLPSTWMTDCYSGFPVCQTCLAAVRQGFGFGKLEICKQRQE